MTTKREELKISWNPWLVSHRVRLNPARRLRIERRFVELSQPRRRVNGGSVVEVTLTYGQTEYELAMAEEFHSALVAWADSAAPRAGGYV